MIKDQKILITGGAGFIGSNLTEELCKGNEVTIIDDFSTGRKSNLNSLNAKLVEGTITNLKVLKELCRDIDYVFHIGALPSVPRSIKTPGLVHEVNTTGTLNVLIAARDENVKKVVYAASSSAYGDTATLPKVEPMPPNPLSPYAVSKLAGEYYCKVFYEVYGLPTVSVRYFNVYGPKQNPKSEYAAVIPKFITRLLNDQPPIIYGDGEQTRDFTYVKDAIRGTILAGESKNANGEVVNIGGGERITINGLAKKMKEIMGKEIENEYIEEREGDIKHSLADISKAKRLLDYEPCCQIEYGLGKVMNYFENCER